MASRATIIPTWLIKYTVAVIAANAVVTGTVALSTPSACSGVVDCTSNGFDLISFFAQFLSFGSYFTVLGPFLGALFLVPIILGWGPILFDAVVALVQAILTGVP